MPPVQAFHPDLHSSQVRQGMQGQGFVTVIEDPESPLCQVKILMEPGKVSAPHRHDILHIFVTLDVDAPPVLTLSGNDLESGTWLLPGGTLWIKPTVPHVAILPASLYGLALQRPAVATENRVGPGNDLGITAQDDVIPMPYLVPLVRQRIEELGLDAW